MKITMFLLSILLSCSMLSTFAILFVRQVDKTSKKVDEILNRCIRNKEK